jgi:hypothetical protein
MRHGKQIYRQHSDSEPALTFLRSDLANPPITNAEAQAAERSGEKATCCWHGGRINAGATPGDADGKVFFCPNGRMYWRYVSPRTKADPKRMSQVSL